MCPFFFCRVCSAMFTSNDLLWQHIGEHTFTHHCLDCNTGFKLRQHLVKHNCRAKREGREEEKRSEVPAVNKGKLWRDPEMEMQNMAVKMKMVNDFEKEETNRLKADKNFEKEDQGSDNTSDCGFAENESGYASDKEEDKDGYASDKEINEEDDEDDMVEENIQSEKLKKNLEEFCYSSVFCFGYDD